MSNTLFKLAAIPVSLFMLPLILFNDLYLNIWIKAEVLSIAAMAAGSEVKFTL
jgi:hypothetical protein